MESTSIKYSGIGTISKKPVFLEFRPLSKKNIILTFPDGSSIDATTDHIVAANRNTVLGKDKNNVCFVEHLLATINLLNLGGIEILVNGPEIPLEDGSGKTWFELLKNWPSTKNASTKLIELPQTLSISDESGRSLIAIPNSEFRLTYLFESPVDKSKTWTTWTLADGINKLIEARTFASSLEHEMLGLKGKLMSYDQDGFDMSLRWTDEPALHKLFDLFGDLSLCGLNPLNIQAHFISVKGGHNLNTQMASLIRKTLHIQDQEN